LGLVFCQFLSACPTIYFWLRDANAQNGGSPITDDELALAKDGKFLEFWRSRYAGGDPVAKTALTGWDPDFKGASFFGKVSAKYTWYKLESYISSNKLTVSMEQIGAELALAHANSVMSDTNSLLSPEQVAAYHHTVFANHDIPAGIFGGTHNPINPSGWIPPASTYSGRWCAGCDSSP
jgi:hypothetical protein